MVTKYVSPTGLDTNDGDTSSTPYLTIDKAFDNLSGTGDDTVWLADGEYNQTTNLLTGGGTKTAGSITLRSISGDKSLCAITGNATLGNWYLLRNSEAGVDMVVREITFKDHVRDDGLSIIFWADQDLTLIDCAMENLHNSATSGAPTGLIRNYHASNPANLTISGLTVTNCSVNWSGGTGYEGGLWSTNQFGGTGTFSDITIDGFTVTTDSSYQYNGTMFHRGTSVFSGTNTFKNITINCAHASYGLIKMESTSGGYKHKISGTLTIDNVNQTLTTANGSSFGYINVSSTDSLTFTAGGEIKNCTSIVPAGESDFGFIASVHASSSLNMYSASAGSVMAIHDNVGTLMAGCVQNNGGGGAQIRSVVAYNNTLLRGPVSVSSVGGDTHISGCLSYNNTVSNGGGIYAQPASGTNVINITNCTIADNTASVSGNGMYLAEATGTTATYNVSNCIVRNGGTGEIVGAGTGDPVINIDTSNIEGGAGAVTGEDTYTDNFDVDPLFNIDYTLKTASTMRGAGAGIGCIRDQTGRAYRRSTPDIGSYAFASGAPAESRTARA